ncbi:MurR/RpiR family transcriptional regulator [Halovulum sp. GXIMD14794]
MDERAVVDVAPGDAPGSVSELLEKLDGMAATLPNRLKQCAEFTRRHLHLIAVSTVSDMAKASGVAPSVYMRFCQALGFTGYSEMQALFRARFAEFRPDYDERLANLQQEGAVGTGRLLADFAESGHKSLMSLANTVTNDRLDRIARGLASARVVHLVGLRRAFAVVSNMAYLFDKLGVPASLHSGSGMLVSGGSIMPGDVVFAVTFSPFSEETIRLAGSAAKRGVTVYGLTDSGSCPMAEYATEMLIAREDEVGGFRALTGAITLTTTLAVAVRALRQQS